MKTRFDRKDAINVLMEAWREQQYDDAIYESRQHLERLGFLEDSNYLELKEDERERLQYLTDDEVENELQEMLATEIRRKIGEVVELTERLVGKASETDEVQ